MHKRSTLFLSLVKVVVVVVAVVACDPHGCNGRQTAKKMNRKRPTEGTGERDETLQNCCGVVLSFFFFFLDAVGFGSSSTSWNGRVETENRRAGYQRDDCPNGANGGPV